MVEGAAAPRASADPVRPPPREGDLLPSLRTGPMTRHRIALYAHGSGDVNPIHVDQDFARADAGLPDVIVHGMFTMGMMSRLVTRWAGPLAVRSIETRFEAMVAVHQSIVCNGTVVATEPCDRGHLVTVDLVALADGTRVASGSASVFVASDP